LSSIITRLSTRNRGKPTPYTPYKYEGYKLNKKKALDKKVQQSNRSVDMELQYKHGVMSFRTSPQILHKPW
jgi:rhamnose utilization protein RhaD (predicted bifunctional aldolase and dehydrogenase)